MPIRANHEAIARLIQERGYSVTHVASSLGIERSNLAHMLAGRRALPVEHVPQLATLLAVRPYELLGPEDPRAAVIELAAVFQIAPHELATT